MCVFWFYKQSTATKGLRIGLRGGGPVASSALPPVSLVISHSQNGKRLARLKTTNDTNAYNLLEKDTACFDKAWRCNPLNREASSYAELVGALKFLNKNRRLAKQNLHLRLVITRLFVNDCIKAKKFDAATEALSMWSAVEPGEVWNEDFPKFRCCLQLCLNSPAETQAADIDELVRNLLEAFYCNGLSDLFAEPTEGKRGLPSDLAVCILTHYTAAVERTSQDRITIYYGKLSSLQTLTSEVRRRSPGTLAEHDPPPVLGQRATVAAVCRRPNYGRVTSDRRSSRNPLAVSARKGPSQRRRAS